MTSPPDAVLHESAEDLFENAPCGYLTTDLHGTILKVNRTFETLSGYDRTELVDGRRRFVSLLSPGGRIYHETHYAPLLRMQGEIREVAFDLVCADATRRPVLVNSTLVTDDDGTPRVVRTTVFDATDRRRYEEELLHARRREQDIAQTLQRSMLAGDPPDTGERLDVHVAYRPAVAGLDVGGDWYDAFWLDDGARVALVVGDVVGRGIEAAATMGQLRSAVRALASTGLSPGPLVDALDGFAARHGVGRMTTIVCASLDLDTSEFVYACAAHMPPVVVAPGRPPELAWEGRSLPLDAIGPSTGRAEATIALAPGSTVVLYTDGLIEQRKRSITVGFEELVRVTDAHRDEPVGALSDALMRGLVDPEHRDDVCLLIARLAG